MTAAAAKEDTAGDQSVLSIRGCCGLGILHIRYFAYHFRAVLYVQFSKYPVQMRLDGLLADAERGCNVLILVPLPYQIDDRHFAVSQSAAVDRFS